VDPELPDGWTVEDFTNTDTAPEGVADDCDGNHGD